MFQLSVIMLLFISHWACLTSFACQGLNTSHTNSHTLLLMPIICEQEQDWRTKPDLNSKYKRKRTCLVENTWRFWLRLFIDIKSQVLFITQAITSNVLNPGYLHRKGTNLPVKMGIFCKSQEDVWSWAFLIFFWLTSSLVLTRQITHISSSHLWSYITF